jgi:2-polyprenyl-6-methoxyphenol hydroxylase-like FAD-dependent oxidoreductase
MHWMAKWHRPIPDLLSATDPKVIIKTGIYDRRPKRRWSEGCATLLGDAAHPTTPNMGQGGCLAIEDAAVLARCMAEHADVTTAYRIYERLRYARTARVTNISRYYGVVGQWSNPVAAWFRSALFYLGSGKGAAKNYAKFVAYDAYESL